MSLRCVSISLRAVMLTNPTSSGTLRFMRWVSEIRSVSLGYLVETLRRKKLVRDSIWGVSLWVGSDIFPTLMLAAY